MFRWQHFVPQQHLARQFATKVVAIRLSFLLLAAFALPSLFSSKGKEIHRHLLSRAQILKSPTPVFVCCRV
jgi:hypothetical protein